MTNKEKAQALYDLMVRGDHPRSKRLAAWDEMLALTKATKASFAKLTGSHLDFKLLRQEIEALPETDPLDEPAHLLVDGEAVVGSDDKPIVVKPKPKSDTRGDQRGLISSMVRCELMDTTDSYALIVERVKAKFPNANTTTRSVASVAADLRRDGVAVASRRPAKGGQ